ncbi:MAG: NAD(P)/FAD-dependent oxidoreductase [Anaerolineales bacterium]|nr:NAD(P)/FAD-dependent oxidoreductase [Anaerolineales bacterium]
MKKEDVIIVGAGPAGLATALQLERYGIKPLVIEKGEIGGLLHNANLVENYPGFPGGIPGPQLVDLFKQQVRYDELNLLNSRLTNLDYSNDRFEFSIKGKILHSHIAVIASGTKPRLLRNLPIPPEIQDKLYYEVYPLLEVKDRQIAIIGAGDAAFDYGLNLAQENDVIILNRGVEISCLPLLWERSKLNPRIQYHAQTAITRISPGPGGRISLECNSSRTFVVDYLIAAIGRDPSLDFISGQFAEKTIQLENSGKLYYVGDVANGLYRQTAIAVGNGILAAMKIYKFLKEKD